MKRIGRLHVLTDADLQSRFSAVELARLAIAGGADAIQLRQKWGSTRELVTVAAELQRLCREAGVTFIVNDRLDVALAVQADGVHLGQEDLPLARARQLLGAAPILGGSTSTAEEARQCVADGADYVGFGPVFPTGSKRDAAPPAGLGILRVVAAHLHVPVVAIGGVGADNASEVLAAGAHGVAVISAVCCRPDPEGATRELRWAIAGASRA